MTLVAKSDFATGNSVCSSYVLRSGDLVFALTAPTSLQNVQPDSTCPLPGYSAEGAYGFLRRHGLAVRSIGAPQGCAAQPARACG